MTFSPSSKMGLYKPLGFLIATLISLANGNYHYENYKVYNFAGDAEPYRKPWFLEDYARPFDQGTQFGHVQDSGDAYESVAEQKSPEVYENPADAYFVASTKKVPNEDKNFKKSISPFYTLKDSDNEKYKSIILKSGVPYCQETKTRVPKKRYRRDAMTCYKCKDPKNGATYEQCSYTSEPQETVEINEYVPLPSTLRYRRSNANGLQNEKTVPENPPNYRFGEEYFAPAASTEVNKKMENCDKVVKDSMVCMVCKDPKTNGKYEQCSYTNQPEDKAYAYSKSSSFGLPEGEKNLKKSATSAKPAKRAYSRKEAEEVPVSYKSGDFEGSHPEVDKYFDEQAAAIKKRTPKHKTLEESAESTRLESGSENVKDGSCKKVVKDDMVCMICKDPKTGGNYEQCSYAHHPSDKVYQFSRQKSFGYPGEEGEKSSGKQTAEYEAPSYGDDGGEEKKSADNDYHGYDAGSSGYYQPEQNSENGDEETAKYNNDQPSEKQESREYVPYKLAGEGPSAEHVKSESEKISEEIKDGGCEKVQKDSMTCMVCKDPKTGGNYEQCSYAYEPNDKVFSFSRAKSFGSPGAEEKGSYTGSEENPTSEYSDQGSYGLASDSKPYVAGEEANSESNEETGTKDPSKLTVDFFSTAEKKKEIEKVLSEFQQEDRSKCKKVKRDKLTCFQCTDKDGVQKEECIFVAAQEPAKDRVAYREVKEFQRDPAAAAATGIPEEYRGTKSSSTGSLHDANIRNPVTSKKQKRTAKKTKAVPVSSYAEPTISASENQEETSEAEEDSEIRGKGNDEAAESEPYDYTAETKPTYDKVLGLTLPRYMLTTSEHEAEFDEVVASSKI